MCTQLYGNTYGLPDGWSFTDPTAEEMQAARDRLDTAKQALASKDLATLDFHELRRLADELSRAAAGASLFASRKLRTPPSDLDYAAQGAVPNAT